MAVEVEVYQDLSIRGATGKKAQLRQALLEAASGGWSHDPERSAEVGYNSREEVMVFRRAGDGAHPESGLVLWETGDGYYVPNIVPRSGSLDYSQYNAILLDFAERVAEPASVPLGCSVETTKPRQAPDDWLSAGTAASLRRFSGAANRSTGASHPSDQRRWFEFLIAAYREKGERLGTDRLARWLVADGWERSAAHQLAADYEKGVALLRHYDPH